MKNKSVLWVSAITFVIILAFVAYHYNEKNIDEICFEDNCFEIEIADSPQERQIGLMYREQMDEDEGMLFIFEEEGSYNFWMKNTLISLDIIWMNKDFEVVYIEHNAQPCLETYCDNFGSEDSSKYVLEIDGGLAERLNIQIGDMAKWKKSRQ